MPPLYLSRITGIRSSATGVEAEGLLYALSATPRQMLRHRPEFTYRRVLRVARLAQRRGARLLGLGAFTSIVGDAGVSIAEASPLAVTSGNSLTVAAAVAAAEHGATLMGVRDFTRATAMVVGATGSIGSACARLLAESVGSLVLVSRSRDRLDLLRRRIAGIAPGTEVLVATRADDGLPRCDFIITATSAAGGPVLDINRCRPGAVILDVARPHDIDAAAAAGRPDVLVIDSGEVIPPGTAVDSGYPIGLAPGTLFACMAETALLTLEGRYQNFTLGRDLELSRIKEIWALFKSHGFRLAPIHSFGVPVDDLEIARKRQLAQQLRSGSTLYDAPPATASGTRADNTTN